MVLILHVSLFGILEWAGYETAGGSADAFFGWREVEVNRHSVEVCLLCVRCACFAFTIVVDV